VLKDFQQELIRRLELAQRLQDSIKADSCLTDDDRIRLSNLEAAVSRIQRLADSRLSNLHSALKLVSCIDVVWISVCYDDWFAITVFTQGDHPSYIYALATVIQEGFI